MNIRRIGSKVALAACALAISVPAMAFAMGTVDVLYMNDGRVLQGEILSETPTTIVFNYTNPKFNSTVKLEISVSEINKIERDVEMSEDEGDSDSSTEGTSTKPRSSGDVSKGAAEMLGLMESYGAKRASQDNENATSFYIVPMNGTMGTDIHLDVYKEMIDDIRAHDPDYLVFVMECRDHLQELSDTGFSISDPELGRDDSAALDRYRELVTLFHVELGDIDQVLWIHNSFGISSIIALSWDNIFMKPEALLAGASRSNRFFEGVRADANMYGKFREAYMGWLRGLTYFGDSGAAIVDAMMRPDMILTCTWKGREIEWFLDDRGEFILDGSEEITTNFNAKYAEDFLISDGTADTLDDLALLMGIREYSVIEGESKSTYDRYVTNWRRSYDGAINSMLEFEKHISWASGDEALRWLGRAKGDLEDVLGAIRSYDAVRYLMQQQGISETGLRIQIQALKDQILALRQGNRRGGGRSGGGGMSGGNSRG